MYSSKKGIDLGCASGILMLLLLSRGRKIHMTGIELDTEAAELAQANMIRNGLQERSRVIHADLREYRQLFAPGCFDLIVSNPPYFPLIAGGVCPDERRAAARNETTCTLEDICACAEYLCRWGGTVNFVYKPERLPELFSVMQRHGIEPKRMRLAAHRTDAVPGIVLVEGRRGGNPGFKIEPTLFLKEENGEDSPEIREIYHRV